MKRLRKTLKKILSLMLGILLAVGLMPATVATAAQITSFDHIDIQSAASFTYWVDGVKEEVEINFHDGNGAALQNIKLFRENLDGTRTQIPVSGRWQRTSGNSGDWEYRVPGSYARYYDNSNQTAENEVRYFIEYSLSVDIAGQNETLVFTSEKYSYSSKNNVCPGQGSARGIDIVVTGEDLTHYFSMTEVVVEKKWENTETLPESVTMELTADGEATGKTMELAADGNWQGGFQELEKYDENGREISYAVNEVEVNNGAGGETAATESGFIVYGEEENAAAEKSVEGRWDIRKEASEFGWTVTNSWVSANYRFDGSTEFYIEKVDEKGAPMAGVEFEINGEIFETGADGKIQVLIPEELTVANGTKSYEIREVKTAEGYELDSGVVKLEVEIESSFMGFNMGEFTNLFSKKFTFTASGNENYKWNAGTRTFVLKNEIANIHEPGEIIDEPDPCALGGCGGADDENAVVAPGVVVIAPNTGRAMSGGGSFGSGASDGVFNEVSNGGSNGGSATASMLVTVVAMVTMVGVVGVVSAGRRK